MPVRAQLQSGLEHDGSGTQAAERWQGRNQSGLCGKGFAVPNEGVQLSHAAHRRESACLIQRGAQKLRMLPALDASELELALVLAENMVRFRHYAAVSPHSLEE